MTIHGAGGLYFSARARDEQSGAVQQRAWAVDGEYHTHAANLDRQYSPAGTTPIADRLAQYGPRVRGLVFGQYAEASDDVHFLLEHAATGIARQRWRRFGARNLAEARGAILQSLKRRLGVFVAREYARHRLRRVPYIGLPRAAVERALGERQQWAIAHADSVAPGVRAVDFFAYQALHAAHAAAD